MTTERIKKIFDEQGIFITSQEIKDGLGQAIYDVMTEIAEDLEENEPYAVKSIEQVYEARGTVQSYIDSAE